jgi:RimJ/RimL family protein N-acetyltransferase
MVDFNIRTERLFIRILEMKDKEAFFAYRCLPEIGQYQLRKPTNITDAERFINRNCETIPNTPETWLQLAICLPDGQMIGDVGIHFLADDQIEIGYTLAPQHQGKGYAGEAVRGVITYAFSVLGKHRITASVDPANAASIRFLERIGFRKEAHFVKSLWMDDHWADDCIYAMLEEEWKTH